MRALRKEFIMLQRKRIVTACAALLFAVTGHAQLRTVGYGYGIGEATAEKEKRRSDE